MEQDAEIAALQRLCDTHGIAVVVQTIGSSEATVKQLLKGVKLPSGKSRGIGRDLRARLNSGYPDWLTVTIQTAHKSGLRDDDVLIPQFDTGGSMGSGVLLHEQPGVIREWRVSDEWVRMNVHRITSAKNLAIVTGFGPSMQPLFNPGDPLLVDRGITRADIDGIYFFRVGNEGFVKQLQRIPTRDGLILRAKSYNHLYDSFDITDGMDFEVFARVVKVWKGDDF